MGLTVGLSLKSEKQCCRPDEDLQVADTDGQAVRILRVWPLHV